MDVHSIREQLRLRTIYDLPLRVTFYARVSTDKYEQANSLKNQMDYFEEMIKSNTKWTYVQGYVDEGISGTSVNKRDSFLKMIYDAKQHKFDFVITKEISRFSRNTLDSIKYTQELLSYGVGILFQSDNINTLYPDFTISKTPSGTIATRFSLFLISLTNPTTINTTPFLPLWGLSHYTASAERCKFIFGEARASWIHEIFTNKAQQ